MNIKKELIDTNFRGNVYIVQNNKVLCEYVTGFYDLPNEIHNSLDNGFKYWQEVYYHGEITSAYHSMFLDILNQADMQIDKYGNDVGYDKRLEDIKNRYGEESKTYCDAKILIDKLRGNYNGY